MLKEHADSALLCLFLTFHWLVAWKQEPRQGWKASFSSSFLLLLVLGPFYILVGVSSIEHVSFLALTTFAKLWLEFPDAWLFTNHQGCAFRCALNIKFFFFVMKLVSLDHKKSRLTVSPLPGARVCLPVSRVLVSYRMSGWVVWCSSGVASSSSPPPTFGNCGHLPPAAKTSSRQPKPLHWYKEQRSSGERQP